MSLRRVDFDLHFKLDCDWDWEWMWRPVDWRTPSAGFREDEDFARKVLKWQADGRGAWQGQWAVGGGGRSGSDVWVKASATWLTVGRGCGRAIVARSQDSLIERTNSMCACAHPHTPAHTIQIMRKNWIHFAGSRKVQKQKLVVKSWQNGFQAGFSPRVRRGERSLELTRTRGLPPPPPDDVRQVKVFLFFFPGYINL